jgi:hypothetical protein
MIPDFHLNIQNNLNNYNNISYINQKNYINYDIKNFSSKLKDINYIKDVTFLNKFKTNTKFIYEMNNYIINTKIFFTHKLYSKYNTFHSRMIHNQDMKYIEHDNIKDHNLNKYHFNKLQIKLLDICNLISDLSQDSVFMPEISNIHWIDIERIIDPQSNAMLLEDLQINYNSLQETDHLSVNFDLDDLKNTHYQFNDIYIDSECDQVIVESLKKNFTDLKDRQLISNYANHKILSEAVKTFLNLCPKFKNYPQTNASTNYIIKKLPDGNIAFTLLYHSSLINPNGELSFPFKHFGIRAQCILSQDDIPVAQYSYFLQ